MVWPVSPPASPVWSGRIQARSRRPMFCPAKGSHLTTSAVTASSTSCERGKGCQPTGSSMKKVTGPSGRCGSRALMATQPWIWLGARPERVERAPGLRRARAPLALTRRGSPQGRRGRRGLVTGERVDEIVGPLVGQQSQAPGIGAMIPGGCAKYPVDQPLVHGPGCCFCRTGCTGCELAGRTLAEITSAGSVTQWSPSARMRREMEGDVKVVGTGGRVGQMRDGSEAPARGYH